MFTEVISGETSATAAAAPAPNYTVIPALHQILHEIRTRDTKTVKTNRTSQLLLSGQAPRQAEQTSPDHFKVFHPGRVTTKVVGA